MDNLTTSRKSSHQRGIRSRQRNTDAFREKVGKEVLAAFRAETNNYLFGDFDCVDEQGWDYSYTDEYEPVLTNPRAATDQWKRHPFVEIPSSNIEMFLDIQNCVESEITDYEQIAESFESEPIPSSTMADSQVLFEPSLSSAFHCVTLAQFETRRFDLGLIEQPFDQDVLQQLRTLPTRSDIAQTINAFGVKADNAVTIVQSLDVINHVTDYQFTSENFHQTHLLLRRDIPNCNVTCDRHYFGSSQFRADIARVRKFAHCMKWKHKIDHIIRPKLRPLIASRSHATYYHHKFHESGILETYFRERPKFLKSDVFWRHHYDRW